MSMSLNHFFRISLVVCGLLLSGQALALQIKQPLLMSRMGEPLKVQFGVSDISPEEEQSLKISLADILVYQSTQINRVAGLDGIEFEVTKQADGLLQVLATGKQPIQDEHADLIIDFEWAGGRRYINIGLNLQATPSQAVSPPTDPAQTNSVTAPATEQTASPATPATPAAPQEAVTPTDKYTSSAASAEVEVRKGDTASQLLQHMTTSDISLEQLLMAMLHNNPDAFVASNVNRLKAGALITLPTAQEASTYERKQARESIRLQASDFNAYRASLGASAPMTKQAKGSQRETSGKLKGEVSKKEKPPANELTLSKPGDSEAEKLSKQLQEEEQSKQAKEVSNNLSQLGRLSQAASQLTHGFALNFSGMSAYYEQGMAWVKRYMFELIAAIALLAAFAVSFSLMRDRRRMTEQDTSADFTHHEEQSPQGLNLPPDLNLDLDLDAPTSSSEEKYQAPLPPNVVNMPAFPVENKPSVIDPGEDPFVMRLELADELWKLGQKQTALALAQEVADQTHGEIRDMAQSWLKEHS